MNESLKNRTEAFAKSLTKLHWLDRAKSIEDFILTELKAREVVYTLTPVDLSEIHSNAVRENLSSPNIPNDSNGLTLWWTMGVLAWLRAKGFVLYYIKYDNKGDTNGKNSNSK